MKSDVVKVTNSGAGVDAALHAAYASAVYRGLGKKESLHLRLLTEETLGLVRQIAGETEADFWVESEGENFRLHLVAYPLITKNMRKQLLEVASTGKNEAAKGFMGKIRDIFDRALARDDVDELPDYYLRGLTLPDAYLDSPVGFRATAGMVWSMNNYKTSVEGESAHSAAAKEEWDELEKSIVTNIADEVKISIAGDKVEMTVYKNFAK